MFARVFQAGQASARQAARRGFSTARKFTKSNARVATAAAVTAAAASFAVPAFAHPEAEPVAFKTEELKKALESDHAEALARIYVMKKIFPENLAIKHFNFEYFETLSAEEKTAILMCARSGIENGDSGMGAYAMQPADYDRFKPYMDAVLRDYHGVPAGEKHVTDWNLAGVKGLPANGKLDLRKLGLENISMRVRVGRNLSAFPLPGAMTQDNRTDMENAMVSAFKVLIKDPNFGGEYCSLTPGHAHQITEDRYKELVKAHIMFKDMAADTYLASAGIASSWPYGRGCYISKDKEFIVWVGEEDHLRIMCMKKGAFLNEVFDRLRNALDTMETLPNCKFAHSDEFGYVTSCPTNLGTGMRASVHVAIPKLTKDGQDVSEAKAVCKQLGLSVRGVGGEHTAAGAGGIVDISPSARFCIKECEIITALYTGISELMKKEQGI